MVTAVIRARKRHAAPGGPSTEGFALPGQGDSRLWEVEREGCRRDGIRGQVGRALPGQEARGSSPWAERSPLTQVPWPRVSWGVGGKGACREQRRGWEWGTGLQLWVVEGGGRNTCLGEWAKGPRQEVRRFPGARKARMMLKLLTPND